jgi:hypothetical protein
MALQEVQKRNIRYSQRSIAVTFAQQKRFAQQPSSVETWIDSQPYNLPVEVAAVDGVQFLSLDNRRLYSAKKNSLYDTLNCIVYQLDDSPSDLMIDKGIDFLQVVWVDNQQILHQLTLRALTIEGVMMIRCATQDSSFPILGHLQPDPSRGPRTYDPETFKIIPNKPKFSPTTDPYIESFRAADRIFIRIKININQYHRRDDLREVILERPELFQLETYERSDCIITLRARGENKSDTWDDWDDLLVALSEEESNDRDEYEFEFFESLKVYCEVFEYDVPAFASLPETERKQKEKEFVDKYKAECISIFLEPVPWLKCVVEIVVENSIDFVIKGGKEVRNLGKLLPSQLNLYSTTMIQRKDPNPPTIQYDLEAKSDLMEHPKDGVETLVIIELSDKVAFAVPCTREEELGMMWTTKQCFGFTSRGQRCKNRRHSSNSRQSWCHHHLSQKTFFETNPTSSCAYFVPDWW